MLETERKISIFKVKEYWFCNNPFDVSDCDSVIFHECGNKNIKEGFTCTEFKTLTLDLCQDLDMIWAGFSKKSCRYEIKRADRDGVNVYKTANPMAFAELNKSFRQQKGLSGNVSIEYMQKYCTLFVAFIKNEFVAGQLYLEDRDNIRWLFGASKRLESDNPLIGCANRALIFSAIRYAKGEFIKEFDFGGYYDGTEDKELESISFFKKTFGGVVTTKYNYVKNYSKVFELGQKLKGLIN